MKSLILIDGKNFLFRNFYAHSMLTTNSGEYTGALYGCLHGLLTLAHQLPDTPIVFVWDGGGQTWRHKLLQPDPAKITIGQVAAQKASGDWFSQQVLESLNRVEGKKPKPEAKKIEGYKAQRFVQLSASGKKEREKALQQIPELKYILRSMGLRGFSVDGLEGDDLIGILARRVLEKRWFEEVIIHSTDKDFYQLLPVTGIRILRGSVGGKMEWADKMKVALEHGVLVEDWVKYRALMGDPSDNIPNVLRGIGPKTAAKFLKKGLDASMEDYHQLPQSAMDAVHDFTKGTVDFPDFWQKVRRNYLLCRIVCAPEFELFPVVVRGRLRNMLAGLDRASFLRADAGKSEAAYHELGEWLTQKEMATLRGRMDEFWSLV